MSKLNASIYNVGIQFIEWFRLPKKRAFHKSKYFNVPSDIHDLADMVKEFVFLGNQTGEGWFLTGEML